MAIPATAFGIKQPLDPRDVLDVEYEITQGTADIVPTPILGFGESIASFVLSVTPEAAALGLRIKDGTDGIYPAPVIANRLLTFWLMIDPASRSLPIFDAGVKLALELTIVTTNSPPREKQRTLVQQVIQL